MVNGDPPLVETTVELDWAIGGERVTMVAGTELELLRPTSRWELATLDADAERGIPHFVTSWRGARRLVPASVLAPLNRPAIALLRGAKETDR